MAADIVEPGLILLVGAAASGLSTYAALGAPGLAADLGFIELPGPLEALALPSLWVPLLVLHLVEWGVGAYRLPDLAWGWLHTLVRPLTAGLFVAVGLASFDPVIQWPGTVLAVALALWVHLLVLGLRTVIWTVRPVRRPTLVSAAGFLPALTLPLIALSRPQYAAAIVGVLLVISAFWAPTLVRAGRLTIDAVWALIRRPTGPRRWRSGADGLPRMTRRALEDRLGLDPDGIRWAPAILARNGARYPFRRGALVLAGQGQGPLFATRRRFRPAVIPLRRGAAAADDRSLIETIRVQTPSPYALCVSRSAPAGTAILAEIGPADAGAAADGTSGRVQGVD